MKINNWAMGHYQLDFLQYYNVCLTSMPGGDGRTDIQSTPLPVNAAPEKVLGTAVTPTSVSGKAVGPVLSPGMPTKLDLRNASGMNVKTSPTSVPQPCAGLPSETWIQVLFANIILFLIFLISLP